MIFGFNTDVAGKGAVYHVQTEDRGAKNPVVDSIVYVGGKIVDRRRTRYVPGEVAPAQVEEMVRKQHKELVEAIRSGHFVPSGESAESVSSVSSGYVIQLLNPTDLYRDGELRFELRVQGKKQLPGKMEVRWILDQAVSEKRTLKLEEDGKTVVCFPVPANHEEAALLVCAEGSAGRELAKFRVYSRAAGKA
ncbi:MAG: hypothetical protein HY648_13370 [Acidobacteria bacterium]|nr:hypothetical protein [Acidobacteriota bacterium]